ncbi:MAG TPA: antitoxin MazE family protein [Casimicrobiaceae bacterium]|nr:antitoxin MazE family protein [Casimicrobiaceae bacterium]
MATSSAARVQKRRAALRKAGLRPVQIWVPDTRRPSFAKECRRQAGLLRDDPKEREILRWIEKAYDPAGWK